MSNNWTRSDTADGNGSYWCLQVGEHADDCDRDDTCACGITYVSAWEEAVGGVTQWYAWTGTYNDHDREMTRSMTAVYPTRDEAVAAIPGSN